MTPAIYSFHETMIKPAELSYATTFALDFHKLRLLQSGKSMKIITWNLQWASPSSKQGRLMREQIQKLDPEVICYTEVDRTFISGGHVVEASGDYGYPHNGERRKVVLWSKTPGRMWIHWETRIYLQVDL
jgi:endonuclease/exonuclease/phosphatase family metal-dependent hydrolase